MQNCVHFWIHSLKNFSVQTMTLLTFSIISMLLFPCMMLLPHRTNSIVQRTWLVFSHVLFLITPMASGWAIIRIFCIR